TRVHRIQRHAHGSFFRNIGVGNHRPVVKQEVLQIPNSNLGNQNPFCQGGCRDGWMSYKDHCHMYVQEQRSWSEAEVLTSSQKSFFRGGFSYPSKLSPPQNQH
ncbi:Lactose-binding lectin l-2, partial [Ophiophagus hannah]